MIYFENNREYILRPAEAAQYEHFAAPVLESDEELLIVCQTVCDGFLFTDRRVIAVDVQGMLGTHADVCSLLYSSVSSFALDREGENGTLELFLAGHKRIRFVFDRSGAELPALTAAISKYTI